MFLEHFFEDVPTATGCIRCRDAQPLGIPLQMAFQPIVDVRDRSVFAYEALVRGPGGEPAGWVLDRVVADQLYTFDQTCRVLAIDTAQRLGMDTRLSIHFLPNAVYEPAACIRLTLAAAAKVGFPVDRLMFELAESQKIQDPAHALGILRDYAQRGFVTAIDDFGAGYAGLALLAEFQPDVVKLDMGLVRGIDAHAARATIVAGMVSTCRALGCRVVAEGVETRAEYDRLRELGIDLFQGYLFARPQLDALVEPVFPAD